MTPADLAQIDLAVTLAMGRKPLMLFKCPKCGEDWSFAVCCGVHYEAKPRPVATIAWSTDLAAAGEMMQWLASNTEEGAIHFIRSQCHPDHMEPTFAVTIAPDNPADSLCYESLPLTLALAVVEVAKRKEALKP